MQNSPLAFQDPTDNDLDELQGDSVLKTPLHRLGWVFEKFKGLLKKGRPVDLKVCESQIVPFETIFDDGRGLGVHRRDWRAVSEY